MKISNIQRLIIIFWHEKTTERTEDTENYYNSVISASSVIDYPYLDHLSGGIKKSQFLSVFTSDQKKLKRIRNHALADHRYK
jgi:bacillopeptidase F (M6 metalloprotease family)